MTAFPMERSHEIGQMSRKLRQLRGRSNRQAPVLAVAFLLENGWFWL